MSWLIEKQSKNGQNKHSHYQRDSEIGNNSYRHSFEIFTHNSRQSKIERDEDNNRRHGSEKYCFTIVFDRITYSFPDITRKFLKPDNDSLRNYNQVIDHNSQHQNQCKRNNIIKTISYSFEINEIGKIDNKKG